MPPPIRRKAYRLGSVTNDIDREARKLEGRGYGTAAQALALEASKQRLAGGGSNISSAEGNRDERDAQERGRSGAMRLQRDSILKTGAAESAAPSGGTSASRPTLSRPTTNASLNEARPGETYSQVMERQRASRAGASAAVAPVATLSRPAAPAAPAPTDAAMQAAADAYGISRTKPAQTDKGTAAPAPVREGRINGMPASQAIAGAQRSLANGGPLQEYGKDIATNNVGKLGIGGAVADYYRRKQLDTERPARAAAWLASEAAAGPGNLGDLKTSEADERDKVMGDAMSASADGTTSRTRKDVVDEANKARVAAGKAPFDDSIYKDMSNKDVSKSDFNRTGLGKAFNAPTTLQRPGVPMAEGRDGPLVNHKDIPEEEARKRRMSPMVVGGVEVPGLGVGAPTPKFKLRR